MYGATLRGHQHASPEAGAEEAAARDRVDRLDELVAGVCRIAPRVEPDRDALLDVRDDVVQAVGAEREESLADCHERPTARGDVEHREKDREVEKASAEVVRLEQHEHGAAPDEQQRAGVLERRQAESAQPAREHLASVAQVPGQKDDEQHLGHLSGLERDRPELHPELRPVDRRRRASGAPAAGGGRSPYAEHVLDAVERR